MPMTIKKLFAILACSLLPGVGLAQQGHPLDGIWLGDWGPDPEDRIYVVLELSWRDTTLSGTINPGFPDAATLQSAALDSSRWTVHLEAEGPGDDGELVRTVIEGQLDNLGSPNRTLTGTWRRGDSTGDFQLRRE